VTIRQKLNNFWLLSLILLIFVPGCGSDPNSERTPVANVDLSLRRSDISIGGPLSMRIDFDVLRDIESPQRDLRVLLHFVDSAGRLMWADDHEPVVASDGWTRGETISYERNIRIPLYPYVGNAVLLIGLYSVTTGERHSLGGEEVGDRRYLGGEITLAPLSDANFVTFGSGWHPDEFSPDFSDQWRWTSERASLFFENPRSDAVLYMELDGRPELFEVPQEVGFFIGDENVFEFNLEDHRRRFYEIRISAETMGTRDAVRLDLTVDQTFQPRQVSAIDTAETGNSVQLRADNDPSLNLPEDPRNLGVRVFYTFLEPT
tara:strand:- start:40621 stop:41574 length:954 start_codon:yes stop_codon:yes gene_type:complete